ncbi:MAG TPA: antibiotic biosynthesis monooxygenase [Rhizomicrobium sp.]
MILETAVFSIQPGEADVFRQAFARGRQFIERSPGFERLELRQGIEAPETFILVVWWQTLEHHTKLFKESENFTQWRAIMGHLFAAPPVVHHYSASEILSLSDGTCC